MPHLLFPSPIIVSHVALSEDTTALLRVILAARSLFSPVSLIFKYLWQSLTTSGTITSRPRADGASALRGEQ